MGFSVQLAPKPANGQDTWARPQSSAAGRTRPSPNCQLPTANWTYTRPDNGPVQYRASPNVVSSTPMALRIETSRSPWRLLVLSVYWT